MGAVFENLTCEELCDLMCGKPEEDGEQWEEEQARQVQPAAEQTDY